MSERLPDNLNTLYSAFSREAIEGLFSGDSLRVDDVEFVCKYEPGSRPDRFFIVKPLPFVEYFVEFCQQFENGSIFELGIAEGGSTALLALVARPAKLVAVDLEPRPLDALDEFARQHGLEEVIRPHWGVDQSDRERLAQIADDELGDGPLDLVLDDASHKLGPTRASFETLFPRLRPGGMFTIEDWNADHRYLDAVVQALRDRSLPGHAEAVAEFRRSIAAPPAIRQKPGETMSQLAVELVLACASSPDAVAEVTVDEHWITVRRGPADLDTATFRLADLFRDHFGFLPTPPDPS